MHDIHHCLTPVRHMYAATLLIVRQHRDMTTQDKLKTSIVQVICLCNSAIDTLSTSKQLYSKVQWTPNTVIAPIHANFRCLWHEVLHKSSFSSIESNVTFQSMIVDTLTSITGLVWVSSSVGCFTLYIITLLRSSGAQVMPSEHHLMIINGGLRL